MTALIKKIFVGIVLATSIAFSQLTSLSLDLRNNYSSYVTQQPSGNTTSNNFNQNYVLSVSGYGFRPTLFQYNLSTSFADYFSTVKNNSIALEQRNQNIGLYNISATVLPQSASPLTLYASKADAKNNTSYDQQFNEAVASYYAPSSFLYQTDVKGVRWNIAKNDYLPSIAVGVERNSSKGKMLMNELELTNTNISGSINNSSANDVSRYSLQYIYNDSKNASFQQNFTNHELQFYGNSKLSDKLDAFSSAVYINRQNSITRTIELGGSFVVDEKTRHNVRLTSTENSLKSNGVYQSLSTSFQHQMYLSLTDQLNMTVGSMASKDHVIINQQSLSSDRGQVQVQLNYTKQLPLFAFNGTYSALLSEEKQLYGNRKFIYSTQAALNATSIRWKTMQFTLRENVDFTRSYVFGNMVNNTVGAEISSTVAPNTLVQVEGERTDTRSSEYAAVSNRVLHTLTGKTQTMLALNTSVDIQSSKRWTYSWYLEKTTTSNVSFNQNGLMRNLLLQARGEYTYNSFTNITMLRGEATAIYQFYAFALQAKYLLFSYSGIQTSGFALEVSRPIQHNFSQQ